MEPIVYYTIRLVGLSGLASFMLYVAYLFYEKQPIISVSLVIVGVVLAIAITISEIYFKWKRHVAPWHYY